ncbi:MAG: SUMF1/EgtB/PvdO family nonheme iron enzyme [Cyanobium sp.]
MPRLLRWQSTTQAFIEPLGSGQALTMVRIPAGRFEMGSPDHERGRDDDEGPVHVVELQEFLMASTPITQAQWQVVARWEPRSGEDWSLPLPENPALFQGEQAQLGKGESNPWQRPVEQISWDEATEFCRRLSQRTGRHYTLPSEAQWEYACRAGSSTPYAFGSELLAELATLRYPSESVEDPRAQRQQTTPVQHHPANAWGLHDMHGNVWEWCLDHWHEIYRGAPTDGSAWIEANAPATADRVVRGGAWSDPPSDARSACRNRLPAQSREPAIVGLRVVCVPGPPAPELAIPSLAPPDRDRSARQPQVLWIDDHPDNNRGERAALAAEGVTVLLASSPEEAIELLAASASVDLLLSDLRQGDDPVAGLRLFPLLQARGIVIPVMFYVGVLNDERTRKALEAGALAVINRRDQLLEAVQTQLASRAAETPA